MGENEYGMLVTLLNSRLDSVDTNLAASRQEIATSRAERDTQMRELRGDISVVKAEINKVSTNGCAHREAHEANYRRSQEDIAFALKEVQALRKAVASGRLNKVPSNTISDFLGTVDWTNKRVTGLAAILVALIIVFAVYRHYEHPVVQAAVKSVVSQ